MSLPQASEVINKDIISHFVLRLVYCRTEELRKWFLSMETTLFRYRFRGESSEVQCALMAEFDLPYKAVSHAEFENVKEKLGQVARSIGGQSVPNADTIFYKVPFEEVPELVAGRRVFYPERVCICCYESGDFPCCHTISQPSFKSTCADKQVVPSLHPKNIGKNGIESFGFSQNVALAFRKWTSTIREREMDRLTPIVESLSTSYLGPDYSQPREFAEISLKDIDQVAKSSFPLCMRHLFEKLREDHHLKHGGRMQFGLFLKGVGLKLEKLVLRGLIKNTHIAYAITIEKKERECEENLRAALGKMGVGNRPMEDVMDKVWNRHYQLACTLTFEAVHSSPCDAGINHPNQYFIDSQKLLQKVNHLCNMVRLHLYKCICRQCSCRGKGKEVFSAMTSKSSTCMGYASICRGTIYFFKRLKKLALPRLNPLPPQLSITS